MSDIFLKKDALNLLGKKHVVFFGDSSKLKLFLSMLCVIITSYMGVRVFNHFPVYIKQLYNDPVNFKLVLKEFLCVHSFYTLNDYFDSIYDKNNDIIHL
jgi:hypothetical protein